MNPFQEKKLRYLFDLLDINNNGFIQLNDFEDIAFKLIEKYNIEEGSKKQTYVAQKCVGFFYELIKVIPAENHRTITADEWCAFFDKELLQNTSHETVEEYRDLFFDFLFGIFDENHDGYISRDEYHKLFDIYGIGKDHLDEAFDSLDLFKDGRLSKYELINALEVFLTSDNPKDRGNIMFGKIGD